MSQPEIRERRFKLELYELNNQLELKRWGDIEGEDFVIEGKTTSTNQEVPEDNNANERVNEQINQPQEEKEEDKGEILPPLCELVTFSARFALNDIPSALVIPATGEEIMYGGDKLVYAQIQELAIKQSPVGVYLTVLHRTRSSNDEEDIQYWPEKCCIFKGFVQPPTFEESAFGAGQSFTIWHWLSALANISMLTTACDIGNPIETTLQGFNLHVKAPTGMWGPLLEGTVSVENIWEDGIKPIYLQILDWGEKEKKAAGGAIKDIYNDFVDEQRERIKTAINKIYQTISVRKILNESSDIQEIIARDLQTDNMSDFVQQDGWSKLISDYFPSYLLAISPQVDQATIIPVPCTVEPNLAIPISLSETFNIQAMPIIPRKISHMTCVAATFPDNNNTAIGTAHYVDLGVYPPKEIERNGINVTIEFPQWITKETVSALPRAELVNFLVDPEKAIKDTEDKTAIDEALAKVQNTVGQYYAQMAYLTQAFNGTFIKVSMPVNMNISPGAMVKIERSEDGKVAFYGTVASVEVNLTSGNTAMTTVLTVSNIRDSDSVNDPIDNPKRNVGFFTFQWTGKRVKLYGKVDD